MPSADFYDSELRAHHEHLRAAHGIGPGDRVLDVGCGAGLTTREAGRAAAPGPVVGIDASEAMIELARRATAADGSANVSYLVDDAQTHRFARNGFDVAISRFGTMFFTDPPAAFANLAAALRPGARLVLLVWQGSERNEWTQAIRAALGDAARPLPDGLDPFSLADPDATTRLLTGAGFEGVRLDDVHEPVFYGRTVADALQTVCGFAHVAAALADPGPDSGSDAGARIVDRLRATLAAHDDGEHGVVFDARSWLVTARRAAQG